MIEPRVVARQDIPHEMLVGEPPLLDVAAGPNRDRRSLDAALRRQRVPTSVARAVKLAISRALEPSPQDRFQHAAEFAAALPATSHQARPSGGLTAPRRPWRLALIAAAGLAGLGGIAALLLARTPDPALLSARVVVAPLENHTGDPTLEPLGHMAADWITQGIARSTTLEVVLASDLATPRGHEGGGSHPDIEQIRRSSGAGTVVTGAYYRARDSIQFHVQLIDAASGNVVRALEPVAAPVGSPLGAFETPRQQVAATLATPRN